MPLKEDTSAAAAARSAAGSPTRKPPGDIEINVILAELDPGMRLENGDDHGEARIVPADDRPARRAKRAWRDKRLNLRPAAAAFLPFRQIRRRRARVVSRDDRNKAEGLATSARPRPVISKTPISSVGPKRFLTARKIRKLRPPSPSKEITASTICSTTRGPAIWPSLVTCPTRITAAPVVFAKRISACAAPRTCETVPGVEFDEFGPHRLNGIDDNEGRPLAMRKRRDNILDARLGGEFDGRCRKSQPQSAQANLIDRLLAGNINNAAARSGERGASLNEQRRFADAGFAAKQQHRARQRNRRP